MMRIRVIVLMGALLLPVGALATLNFASQAPTQAYHSANSNLLTQPSSSAEKKSTRHTSSQTASPKNPAKNLTARLATLQQNQLLFQQDTDRRLEQLSAANKLLASHLIKVSKAVVLLSQEAKAFREQADALQATVHAELPSDTNTGWFSQVSDALGYGANYVLYAILLVLLAIAVLLFRKPADVANDITGSESGSGAASVVDVESDTTEEYDFLGSQEGVGAKLDLARAYLAMEDYTAARDVLAEVAKQGDAEQREQASQLLSKIAQAAG